MMKNFLTICNDAWEESGLSGAGLVNTQTATGVKKRMAGWVRQAWKDIQQFRSDWPWMDAEFTFNTSAGKPEYSLIELSLTDVERWNFRGCSIFKTADGKKTEMPLGSTGYQVYWDRYRMGESLPTQPFLIFFKPFDNTLRLHPVPDAEYTISLMYHKAPQILIANNDTPAMPVNTAWNEIIKWRALYLYAFHDGAPALLDEADIMYDQMITAMDNQYGQTLNLVGGTIA